MRSRPAWAGVKRCLKKQSWAGERDGWVKALATKPDFLGLIPGSHMVGQGNKFLQLVL